MGRVDFSFQSSLTVTFRYFLLGTNIVSSLFASLLFLKIAAIVVIVSFQCVQKPNQPVQSPGNTENLDTKDLKLQEEAQKQPAQTPDNCPSARRAKRMKCEVGDLEETQLI